MVQMSDVVSLHAISNDEVIIFQSKEDLERFLDMYEKEGNQLRKDVFEYMTHYIFPFPQVRVSR